MPEQLLWEEAGSSLHCNPLDAGCASSLQPVTEAVTGEWDLYQILNMEEKLERADLTYGIRLWITWDNVEQESCITISS